MYLYVLSVMLKAKYMQTIIALLTIGEYIKLSFAPIDGLKWYVSMQLTVTIIKSVNNTTHRGEGVSIIRRISADVDMLDNIDWAFIFFE